MSNRFRTGRASLAQWLPGRCRALVYRFVPKTNDAEASRRAAITVAFTLFVALAAIVVGAFNLVVMPRFVLEVYPPFLAFLAVLLWVVKKKGAAELAAHYLMLVVFIFLQAGAVQRGGLASPTAGWFPVAVFVACLMLGRAGALAWALAFGLSHFVHQLRVDPSMWDPALGPPLFYAVPRLAACLAAFGFGQIFETFRKRAYDEVLAREREVREQRDRVDRRNRDLRLVLDSIDQGMIHLDSNGVIASERSAAFDAWFPDVLAGSTFTDLLRRVDPSAAVRFEQGWLELMAPVTPQTADGDQRPLNRADEGRESEPDGRSPARGIAALPPRLESDGRIYRIDYRLLEGDDLTKHVVLMITDVTAAEAAARAEADLQRELRQAQKLESVGRLAAGVAHEINTPIQFVNDSTHFLRESFVDMQQLIAVYRSAVAEPAEAEAEARASVRVRIAAVEEAADLEYIIDNVPRAFDRVTDGLERVSTIVRAMKEFAHPDSRAMTPLDFNRAITSTLTIARSEYKLVADAELDLMPLESVTCHPGEVNQAVLVIIVNAAHAIASRHRATGQRGLIRISTRSEGDLAHLAVSDTGGGIPEAIREKIFDPFFTTKDVGSGTGQGLAIARSIIVDKHHGKLGFTTEVGVGTTFHIRLPFNPSPRLLTAEIET